MILLPALLALPMPDEACHKWLLFGVIPISATALLMGCKKPKHYRVLITEFIGLSILTSAALLSHGLPRETDEKTLPDKIKRPLIDAAVLTFGHFWNDRPCHKHDQRGHDNE